MKMFKRKRKNLDTLKQYAIDREVFTRIFLRIYKLDMDDYLYNYEGHSFKAWKYDDEFYILHKDSGTLVNWYKHLGRTNTCNKNLSLVEYLQFVTMFLDEIDKEVI